MPAEVEADYHRFAVPSGTHWREVTTKTDNLGARIGTALVRLEQANPDSLAGIFGDAAWATRNASPNRPWSRSSTRSTGAEARIREALLTSDKLDTVIGLPANLFYSTSIPACVLVFRATKAVDRRQHVLFVDGSARFTKGRNQNQMSDDDVAAIISAYRSGDDPDGEGGAQVRLVPLDEIKANGYDLNIGRYLKTTAEDEVDLDTALAQYVDARAHRSETERALFARLKAAGIADLGGDDG